MSNSKHNQRGLTLVELMIGLFIMAVVVVAIIGAGSGGTSSAKVKNEVQNLSSILQKARGFSAGRQDYSDLTTPRLINAGGFPTQMVAGTSVQHSWNGAVTVGVGSIPGTFDVVYDAVPTPNCIELVAQAAKLFNQITVGATVVKAPNAAFHDIPATDSSCTAASNVRITFNAL